MNQPQNYQDALYAETQRANQAEYDRGVMAIQVAQGEKEIAQRDIQTCTTLNDSAGLADAYARLARSEAQLTHLEASNMNHQPQTGSYPSPSQAYPQPQQPQQWTPDQIINSMTQLMPVERQFLQDNKDLLTNPANHKRLEVAYYDAIDYGFERGTQPYMEFIAGRMGRNVGGGSPSRPQHPNMPKVSLTREEAANISGVDMATYQENERKLAALKARGFYGDR
jgi:hypothetical protein